MESLTAMPRKSNTIDQAKRKQILLVDDHPLMRRGQADLLNREPDLAVCGEAGTAREAMEAIAKLKPDLVLVDMGLPDKDGLELIKDIQALHPGLPVLAMSMQDESLYAARVLRAGGRGYVMKQEGPERLAGAIRTVLSGRSRSVRACRRNFWSRWSARQDRPAAGRKQS